MNGRDTEKGQKERKTKQKKTDTAVIFENVRQMHKIFMDMYGISVFDWTIITVTYATTKLKIESYVEMLNDLSGSYF